jgi:hypothetical protein
MSFLGAWLTSIAISVLSSAAQLITRSSTVSSIVSGAVELAAIFTLVALYGSFLGPYFQWHSEWFYRWSHRSAAGVWIVATVFYVSLASVSRLNRDRSLVFPALALATPFLAVLAYWFYPLSYWTFRPEPAPRFSVNGSTLNTAALTGVPLAIVGVVVRSRLRFLREWDRAVATRLNR